LLLPLLLRRRQRLRCLSLLELAAGTAKAAAVVAVREALGGCGSVNGRKDGSKVPLTTGSGFCVCAYLQKAAWFGQGTWVEADGR
jgi:hypothetical protein